MIAMSKPPHKFFERYLENDLDSLYNFLDDKHNELISGTMESIPQEEVSKFTRQNGAPTQLGRYYNIFDWDHNGLKELKFALNSMIKEACEYYGIDFDSQNYKIHGWFNQDEKTMGSGVNPIKNKTFYHDHMGGEGAPVFHGYYCVFAEPSITYYKIGGDSGIDFENHNKNNRAIVSETGHPHGRDDWYNDKPRITIAYDICPSGQFTESTWQSLND
jgi:hypothetical protein